MQSTGESRYANIKIANKALWVHVLGVGAGAAVTSSSGVEFGVLDIVVSTSSTALSTGNTLDDAAMSKTGCRVSGMQRPGDGFSRGALYERRGRNDAQKIAHEFLFGCL